MRKNSVSLTMIVRNESANLEACLLSAGEQVDEIVIVDTGSTDETRQIAERYTDRVFLYPWDNDFSAARNYAIGKARGEWILSLDADEQLIAGTGDLRRLVSTGASPEAYMLPLHYPTTDAPGEYNRFLVLRLFKNNGRYRFKGRIHEQIVVTASGTVDIADGPVIYHQHLPSAERNRKRHRNLVLLKQACAEEPDNIFLRYYLAVEWLALGKPHRALPLFREAYESLTDDHLLFRAPALRYLIISLRALGRFEEAIDICRKVAQHYPSYTDIFYLCGVLYEEQHQYHEAVKWLQSALERGIPPAIYSHMHGTGSFLAHYHLGYCRERLGQREPAERHYERAIDANPDYVYPVYNLFLIVQGRLGARQALDCFSARGYLDSAERALAVAELYFKAGYPGLAKRCLERCQTDSGTEMVRFSLGLYNLYSGHLQRVLMYLDTIAAENPLYPQVQIHKALALLLLGRTCATRTLAFVLWEDPQYRPVTRILLQLVRYLKKGWRPEVCDDGLRQASLALLERYRYYLPKFTKTRHQHRFRLIIDGLESIAQRSSPQGALALAGLFQERAQAVQDLLNYQFGVFGDRT